MPRLCGVDAAAARIREPRRAPFAGPGQRATYTSGIVLTRRYIGEGFCLRTTRSVGSCGTTRHHAAPRGAMARFDLAHEPQGDVIRRQERPIAWWDVSETRGDGFGVRDASRLLRSPSRMPKRRRSMCSDDDRGDAMPDMTGPLVVAGIADAGIAALLALRFGDRRRGRWPRIRAARPWQPGASSRQRDRQGTLSRASLDDARLRPSPS